MRNLSLHIDIEGGRITVKVREKKGKILPKFTYNQSPRIMITRVFIAQLEDLF